jgi:hypothetical protein
MARLDVTVERLQVGEAGIDGDNRVAEWEVGFFAAVADDQGELQAGTFDIELATFRDDNVVNHELFDSADPPFPIHFASFDNVNPDQSIVFVGSFGIERDAGPAGGATQFEVLPAVRTFLTPVEPLGDLRVSIVGESFEEGRGDPNVLQLLRPTLGVNPPAPVEFLGQRFEFFDDRFEFSYRADFLLHFEQDAIPFIERDLIPFTPFEEVAVPADSLTLVGTRDPVANDPEEI